MIRAEKLSKRYGKVRALIALDLQVEPGEVLGFLGPNGAGKSTALRILSGYLPPSSGTARVDGLSLTQSSLAARRKLGYLPEAFAAPPEMRVGEYLRYRAGLKGVGFRARRARVGELADRLGLVDRLRQPVAALSKGYRQRVGLADALLADPPALMLDEPFGGLDPLQRQEFRQVLRELAQAKKAILFSSHVLPEVEEVADRVLILHKGVARAEGSYEELSRVARQRIPLEILTDGDPQQLEQAVQADADLTDACPLLERHGSRLLFQPQDATARQRLFEWLARRREPVVRFQTLSPGLEELFERVIGASEEPEA